MAAANDEASKARAEALLAAANAEKAKAEEMERDAQRQFDLEQASATTLIRPTFGHPSLRCSPVFPPFVPATGDRQRRSRGEAARGGEREAAAGEDDAHEQGGQQPGDSTPRLPAYHSRLTARHSRVRTPYAGTGGQPGVDARDGGSEDAREPAARGEGEARGGREQGPGQAGAPAAACPIKAARAPTRALPRRPNRALQCADCSRDDCVRSLPAQLREGQVKFQEKVKKLQNVTAVGSIVASLKADANRRAMSEAELLALALNAAAACVGTTG